MSWRIKIVGIIFFLAACSENKLKEGEGNAGKQLSSGGGFLIEWEEFRQRLNRPGNKLIDFRKKEEFEEGHIPAALNIWRSDIEDQSYPYGGMMASKPQMEALLGGLGISSTDTLLIYEEQGLCNAARLWWILKNYGFEKIKLFDGGLREWKEKGGLLSLESDSSAAANFQLVENPEMEFYISKAELIQALKGNVHIVDTRTADEFSGKRQKKGAFQAGRIPGSIFIDWAEAVNYGSDKKIRTISELEKIYAASGLEKEDSIILYCHSGVRSAHTTFVLTQMLHYKKVKNYDGSWIEWSYFDNLPIEKDSLTQLLN